MPTRFFPSRIRRRGPASRRGPDPGRRRKPPASIRRRSETTWSASPRSRLSTSAPPCCHGSYKRNTGPLQRQPDRLHGEGSGSIGGADGVRSAWIAAVEQVQERPPAGIAVQMSSRGPGRILRRGGRFVSRAATRPVRRVLAVGRKRVGTTTQPVPLPDRSPGGPVRFGRASRVECLRNPQRDPGFC